MKGMVPPDPETEVSRVRYAVIRTPRRNRKRYPAGCVIPVASAAEARARAEGDARLHPAEVVGPSKSSEGQYIYYLVAWLDEA
ncbi:MAG: hypothetical protein D6721_07275 [Gammaproteobacteria bacterium]|nr:MAG: hypothetical protein D6721_07275 [Gammaproteobacteria bacterium]